MTDDDRDDGQQAWESDYAAWCAAQGDDEINQLLSEASSDEHYD